MGSALEVSGKCVGSVPEVLVEGVLEVVGGAKLCLGPLKHLTKSKTKEARQLQSDTCGIRTHAGRPHQLSRPTP